MNDSFLKQIGTQLAELDPLPDWAGTETERLFGAVLGAWLISTAGHDLKSWQRSGCVTLTIGTGVLFAPLVMGLFPSLTVGVAAFIAAIVVVPLSIKLMLWIDATDLHELLRRLRGGQ